MIDDKLIAQVQRAARYREVVPAIFERMNSIMEQNISFVYIVHCAETGLYKIGISGKPQNRLKQLKSGSAYEIELVQEFRVYEPFARPFEQLLHKVFAHCRTHQEWFKLGEIELMWLKSNSCPFSVNLTTHGPIAQFYSIFPESWQWMI